MARVNGGDSGSFGVESIAAPDDSGDGLLYLNSGDPYSGTVAVECFSHGWEIRRGGDAFATTWGGWYEEREQDHCKNEDVIRCGYCGEYTPVDEPWDITECEHCGNCVAG